MTWWEIVGLIAVSVVGWQVVAYFKGNPKFWRLVNRHPDLALTLFTIESGCVVDDVPPSSQKANYTGPFRILTKDGATHKVYILFNDIDAIQARVAPFLYAAEGRAPHLGIH